MAGASRSGRPERARPSCAWPARAWRRPSWRGFFGGLLRRGLLGGLLRRGFPRALLHRGLARGLLRDDLARGLLRGGFLAAVFLRSFFAAAFFAGFFAAAFAMSMRPSRSSAFARAFARRRKAPTKVIRFLAEQAMRSDSRRARIAVYRIIARARAASRGARKRRDAGVRARRRSIARRGNARASRSRSTSPFTSRLVLQAIPRIVDRDARPR